MSELIDIDSYLSGGEDSDSESEDSSSDDESVASIGHDDEASVYDEEEEEGDVPDEEEEEEEGEENVPDEGEGEGAEIGIGGAKKAAPKKTFQQLESDDEDDDDEAVDEHYLQKFDTELKKNYIQETHPESFINNYDEIVCLTKVERDVNGNIIDPLHKTIPILTKYEKTRIVGMRSKQINAGAKPFVKVPEHIIDGYLIAEMEVQQKRVPFIIRRPLPNGGFEYWNIKDLEMIHIA